MDDLNTRHMRFDTEPQDLVRVLRKYSKVKAGPFSWRTPSGEGEIGLYLDVKKSNRDGFECKVNTIRYRRPGGSFFAEDGLHVITLEGSRVRERETLVLIKCHEPKARDLIFVHFCIEMDRLRQELAKPASTSVQRAPQSVVIATLPEEEPTPAGCKPAGSQSPATGPQCCGQWQRAPFKTLTAETTTASRVTHPDQEKRLSSPS